VKYNTDFLAKRKNEFSTIKLAYAVEIVNGPAPLSVIATCIYYPKLNKYFPSRLCCMRGPA